ncbi:4Fe-4S dicluster domain-containing protein [bacterium]|nr:4Fe-4S dicluster domain-containing protein [bacterium]
MEANRRSFLKLTGALIGSSAFAPELLASVGGGEAGSMIDEQWGMLNDEASCTGCKTCQYVCKKRMGFDTAGDSPIYDNPRDLNAENYTVVQLFPGDDQWPHSYVKRQCMHCNDPACAAACPVSALIKREDGPVVYNPDKCIGCRYCMVACPFDVPTFEYSSATPKIQKCDMCVDLVVQGKNTVCSDVCPRNAIKTGKRKDMVAEAFRRIKADPDKYIDHVYGEHEVGGTAVVYISGVPFDKIGFKEYDATSIAALPQSIQHGIFKYWVTPLALFGMLAVTRGAMLKCDPDDQGCIEE